MNEHVYGIQMGLYICVFMCGLCTGVIVLHIFYLLYFHLYFVKEMSGVVSETRDWIDGYFKKDKKDEDTGINSPDFIFNLWKGGFKFR